MNTGTESIRPTARHGVVFDVLPAPEFLTIPSGLLLFFGLGPNQTLSGPVMPIIVIDDPLDLPVRTARISCEFEEVGRTNEVQVSYVNATPIPESSTLFTIAPVAAALLGFSNLWGRGRRVLRVSD
jgi:hypothetical protein